MSQTSLKCSLSATRPDDAANFDQQYSFINNQDEGVAWHIGGNGSGTTEASMNKVAKFVLQRQPPPRKDTPFWIIGNSYEQVIESCWKEKLHGHGHIPDCEIQWDKVTWYDRKRGLPASVPLKPWPGRTNKRNWQIEFKSCGQGREQMQARAIGGFCFVEQFPYAILEEVVRGMREYNFAGSKLFFFEFGDPSTAKVTFSDSALLSANTDPVISDSDGLFGDIFTDTKGTVTLKTSTDVVVYGPIDFFAPEDGITALAASNVSVLDTAGEFTAADVEAALKEISDNFLKLRNT